MAKSKSFGTAVTIGGTAINGLTDVNFSGGDVPTFDTTTHDTTSGKTYVPGLVDNGTLELSGKFDNADAGQDALRAAIGTAVTFVVTYPNSATITCSAIVGVPNESAPLEGTVDFSVTCKITGAKTYSS
jgi:hypothetical protein